MPENIATLGGKIFLAFLFVHIAQKITNYFQKPIDNTEMLAIMVNVEMRDDKSSMDYMLRLSKIE